MSQPCIVQTFYLLTSSLNSVFTHNGTLQCIIPRMAKVNASHNFKKMRNSRSQIAFTTEHLFVFAETEIHSYIGFSRLSALPEQGGSLLAEARL